MNEEVRNLISDETARRNFDAIIDLEMSPERPTRSEEVTPVADKTLAPKTKDAEDISILSDLSSIPKQIVLDSADAVVESGRAVNDFAEWSARHMGIDTTAGTAILEKLPSIPEFGGENTGPISGFFGTMSKFLVGMAGTSKFLGLKKLDSVETLAKMGKVGKAAAMTTKGTISGGGAGFAVFDPEDPNIANIVKELANKHEFGQGLFNALPEGVQSLLLALPDQPGDSKMARRAQAFFSEALAGVPFEAIMAAARVFKAGRDAEKLLKENLSFDKASDELRSKLGDSSLAGAKSNADDAAVDAEAKLKSHQKAHGTKKALVENEKKLGDKVESYFKDPVRTADDPDVVFASEQHAAADDIIKERIALEKSGREARKTAKEIQAALDKQRSVESGLLKGSERFVYGVVMSGKPFNIDKFLPINTATNSRQIIRYINRIVERVEREVARGSSFGSPKLKKEAGEALRELSARMKADGEISTALSEAIAGGVARTPVERIAIEIVRSISGDHVYGLMEAVKRGDRKAILHLPVALARAADIETLAASPSGWFKRSHKSSELDRLMDLSEFGGGRNYNKQAAEMLAKIRQSIPDADGVDIAARLNLLESPDAFRALVSEAGKPGMFHAFLEYFYNSILSGLDTIMNNAVGSHAFLLYQMPVKASAVVAKKFLGDPPPRFGEAHEHASLKGLMAGMQGYGKAFANSLFPLVRNMAKTMALKDPDVSFSSQKFEKYFQKSITGEVMRPLISAVDKGVRFATQDAFSMQSPMEYAVDFAGKLVRMFQNAHATADEFNKQVASNFEKYYRAQIRVDAAGLDRAESKEMFAELIKNTPADIRAMSTQFAEMVTFTGKLEKSESFRAFVDSYPALRMIFPFVRSGAGMLDSFVANTPVGPFISPEAKAMWDKGGADREVALGQAMLGLMTVWQVYEMWGAGKINGDPGRDAPRAEMGRVGRIPNSVLVGKDSWVSKMLDSPFATDKSISGRVIHVDDGDTATVQDANGTLHEIRFQNVDADEKNQRLGPNATAKLKHMVLGKNVTVEWRTKGHFGRIIGNVIRDGKSINKAIIEEAEGVKFKPDHGNYVSHETLGPLSTHISMIVNTLEAFQRVGDPENTRNIMQILAEDVGSNLLDRQYFSGMFTLIDAANSGADDVVGRVTKALIPRIASQAVNTTAGVKRDLNTFDPELTPTALWRKQFMAQLEALDPRYRQDIPQFDGYGNEAGTRVPASIGSYWNWPKTRPHHVRNDASVYDQYLANGFHKGQLTPSITYKKATVELNAEQFVDYQRNLGSAKLPVLGGSPQELTVAMRDLIVSEAYQDADTTYGPKGIKHQMLESVYSAFKAHAALLTLDKYPELQEGLEADIAEQVKALETDNVPQNLPNDIKKLLESQQVPINP